MKGFIFLTVIPSTKIKPFGGKVNRIKIMRKTINGIVVWHAAYSKNFRGNVVLNADFKLSIDDYKALQGEPRFVSQSELSDYIKEKAGANDIIIGEIEEKDIYDMSPISYSDCHTTFMHNLHWAGVHPPDTKEWHKIFLECF